MRIARLSLNNTPTWAVKTDGGYELLHGHPLKNIDRSGTIVPDADARLLVPAEPTKIIAVGLNYTKHAEELKMKLPESPVLFMKPPSALLPCGGAIKYPAMSAQVDYEAELAFVIKERAFHVAPIDAPNYIWGYTNCNDVTARDLQNLDGQWTRAKSFDTFCPVGPHIVTPDEAGDPHGMRVISRLNGEVKQDGTTADFIFDCYELLSFISYIMTLEPGDIVTTGTPSGIGPMQAGDAIEIEVGPLGVLRNTVI